jgi:peroxiredoxin
MLIPRLPVPALQVETVAHGTFDLSTDTSSKFTLLVFYRGLHCPICTKYLIELERAIPEFEKRQVRVITISSDDRERAIDMAKKVKATQLPFGYGLSLKTAKEWGLYISEGRGKTSIGIEEPARFSEPGVFLTKPDGTLYYGSVQTMPFARPNFTDLIGAIDFAVANDYPARGEYVGEV